MVTTVFSYFRIVICTHPFYLFILDMLEPDKVVIPELVQLSVQFWGLYYLCQSDGKRCLSTSASVLVRKLTER